MDQYPLYFERQTPFTSLGFGLGTNRLNGNQKAILGIRIKVLDREHRTAIFPKLIFTPSGAQPRTWTLTMIINWPWNVRRSACIQTFCLMTRLSNWQALSRCPMGCRSSLQGWKDENGVKLTWADEPRGCDKSIYPELLGVGRRQGKKFWQILMNGWISLRCLGLPSGTPKKGHQPMHHSLPWGLSGNAWANMTGRSALPSSRATVSLGYIGLYEVATVFYGPNWEHNPEAKHPFDRYHQGYESARGRMVWPVWLPLLIYSTPSESLTDLL